MNIHYYNGNFLPASECFIDSSDRGLLLGDGIFETIRLYSGEALLLDEHLERLRQGLSILNITLSISQDEIKNIINKLIQLNKIDYDASIRITITRGVGPRGITPPEILHPTVLITVSHLKINSNETITTAISDIKKNEFSFLSKIKSLNFLENIMGRIEVQKKGADEALFFNTRGYLTEASVANVFIVLDNGLHTPPLSDGVLPGIIRKVLFNIAKIRNLSLFERSIMLQELLQAKEVFITNSLIGIKPVVKIDNTVVNNGEKGQLTALLQKYLIAYIQDLHRGNKQHAGIQI